MNAWVNHWPTLSAPVDSPVYRYISHGGGVQTSALCLMAARGDVGPMPDAAYFADTGNEPKAVYEYLDYITPLLPFPLIRLKRPGPSLGDYMLANAALPKEKRSTLPLYTKNPNGMLRKQCSTDWKTRVVVRAAKAAAREKMGLLPSQRFPANALIEQWIGISKDEIERTRTNSDRVLVNRYPIIEANLTRDGCLTWLEERQYRRPPRSACIFCPFRTWPEWRAMKADQPEDFADACAFDAAIRPGWQGMEGEAFVHRSLTPLADVDFSAPNPGQGDLFECEGVCHT